MPEGCALRTHRPAPLHTDPLQPPLLTLASAGTCTATGCHVGGTWHWWEPAAPLARWHRVTRHLADDGSCRPVWLAVKHAAGQIQMSGSGLDDAAPFGVRITVHATSRGPRLAMAISEPLIDGTIAAVHTGASTTAAATVAAALGRACPVWRLRPSRRSQPRPHQDCCSPRHHL